MDNNEKFYHELTQQALALIAGESNLIANLANISALLFHQLENVNWVGFYLDDGASLVVGPFQGKTACVRIPYYKGVCGSAFRHQRVERIDDVDQFDGHIACDATTRSEIVLPLFLDGNLKGVLDIDSAQIARFSDSDEIGLTLFINELQKHL